MTDYSPRCGQQFACCAGLAVVLLAAGCGHKQNKQPPAQATAPVRTYPTYPTQPVQPAMPASSASSAPGKASGPIAVTPVPEGGITDEDKDYILNHRPIVSEIGEATWYTAPYKGRKAANGQVFSDEALTAAHRTLPMGSLIVVTNLTTRQASAMRISDRGPFVPNKILDLTKASAKSIGIYRPGTARVRIDVYETPKPIDTGGRWCVQIGAFTNAEAADRLKADLLHEYPDAKVIEFAGEASWWVRIRPAGDDRGQAEAMARRIQPEEGTAFLTRLD
jgi:rare lipoprotein A